MIRVLILFLMISTCLACSSTEENLKIKGQVIDEITGKPVAGLPLHFTGYYNCFMGCDKDSLGIAITDRDGRFNFGGKDYKYDYGIKVYHDDLIAETDTLASKHNYDIAYNIDGNNISENHVIKAMNAGKLYVSLTNGDRWDSLDIEKLIFKTTNFTDSIDYKTGLYFNEAPNKVHKLEWYYIAKGIRSKTFYDEIYIPSIYLIRGDRNYYYITL